MIKNKPVFIEVEPCDYQSECRVYLYYRQLCKDNPVKCEFYTEYQKLKDLMENPRHLTESPTGSLESGLVRRER